MPIEKVLRRGRANIPGPASAGHDEPPSPPSTPPPSTTTRKGPKKTNGPLTGRGGASRPTRKKKGAAKAGTNPDNYAEDEYGQKSNKRKLPLDFGTKTNRQQSKKPNINPDVLKYVLGADPGMWGTARARTSATADPTTVGADQEWQKCNSYHVKEPSIIALAEDNPGHQAFVDGSQSKFGHQVQDDMRAHSFYKIFLDPEGRDTSFDNPIVNSSIASKLVNFADPTKNFRIAVEAFKHLYRISMDDITKALGRETAENVQITFVLPYPAACSQKGRRETERAARQAGWGSRVGDQIILISEAHASATAGYITYKMQNGGMAWRSTFKVDTVFPTLDIGSLTVDSTSLQVVSNDAKIDLKEVLRPEGGRCGTFALHCQLMERLATKFGTSFSNLSRAVLGRGTKFFEACEDIFRQYEPDNAAVEFNLPLSLGEDVHDMDYDHDIGEATIRGHEVDDIIEAWIKWPKKLLDSQILQAQNAGYRGAAIMVCGGGSKIPAVFTKLEQYCMTLNRTIVRPRNPDAAVAVGAAIHGTEASFLGERMMLASYGIRLLDPDGTESMEWFVSKEDMFNPAKKGFFDSLIGHLALTAQEALDRTIVIEVKVYSFEKRGQNPSDPQHPEIEEAGSIIIAANGFSPRLRNKLRDQINRNHGSEVFLDAAIKLKVDSSGHLFFEAKEANGRCSLGKGELRRDVHQSAPYN